MARYLGDAAGRASKQYTDSTVASNCTALCGYVNTVCSVLESSKLDVNGSASGLSNVVNSITGGSGISVNSSTGAITITASSEGMVDVLYNCACCWNGGLCIPADKQAAYTHYELLGYYRHHHYYCSHSTICFTPYPGCSQSPHSGYCCHQCSCGWVGLNKCNNGTGRYGCGGNMSWTFGCESGCRTACNCLGSIWHARISPVNPCNASCNDYFYCFNTTMNGGGEFCCVGGRNSGYSRNCCGMFPPCMKCFCISTPSGSQPFQNCAATVVVLGFGKLT